MNLIRELLLSMQIIFAFENERLFPEHRWFLCTLVKLYFISTTTTHLHKNSLINTAHQKLSNVLVCLQHCFIVMSIQLRRPPEVLTKPSRTAMPRLWAVLARNRPPMKWDTFSESSNASRDRYVLPGCLFMYSTRLRSLTFPISSSFSIPNWIFHLFSLAIRHFRYSCHRGPPCQFHSGMSDSWWRLFLGTWYAIGS